MKDIVAVYLLLSWTISGDYAVPFVEISANSKPWGRLSGSETWSCVSYALDARRKSNVVFQYGFGALTARYRQSGGLSDLSKNLFYQPEDPYSDRSVRGGLQVSEICNFATGKKIIPRTDKFPFFPMLRFSFQNFFRLSTLQLFLQVSLPVKGKKGRGVSQPAVIPQKYKLKSS